MNFWQKSKVFLSKYKHIFIAALLLLCFVCVAGWVYLSAVRPAANAVQIVRANEDYSQKTQPIAVGSQLCQPISTVQPVYGAAFVFTTYDEVCHGTVTVQLQSSTGEVLASGSKDTTQLLDNTYQEIVFDSAVLPKEETQYSLVLTYTPADGQPVGALGVWCSEKTAEGYAPYVQNGVAANGTLGYSLVTNVAGSFIVKAFWLLTAFAALMLGVGYWLVLVRKVPLHWCFCFLALTLGLVFMLVLPPYVAPDEEVHIHTVYSMSNKLLGIPNEGTVSVRAADDVVLDFTDKVSVFSYQTVNNALLGQCEDTAMVATQYRTASVFPVMYWPATLGVTLARLLNFNYITLILFGRLFNLLCFTALMTLAVWLMPRFKRVLCAVGLLPMCLHLAASFCYDAMVIGMACVYVALVLYYAYEKEKITWIDLGILAAAALLLAPMKMLYVFLCALCLIIPAKKCPGKIKYLLAGVGALAIGFLLLNMQFVLTYAGVSADSLREAANKVLPHVNPLSVDYVEKDFWNLSYVLTHITGTFKLLANTVQQNTALYFTQMVGGELGEVILGDLTVWTPAVFCLLVALGLSAVPAEGETPLLGTGAKLWGAFLIVCTCGALLIVCLGWTPLRNDVLWGMQGRYWLPLVPLALLVLQGKNLHLHKNIERPLLYTQLCLGLLAAVSVFQKILVR